MLIMLILNLLVVSDGLSERVFRGGVIDVIGGNFFAFWGVFNGVIVVGATVFLPETSGFSGSESEHR